MHIDFTKILEVNLFAFAYRLFHEDFSPIDGVLHDTQPFPSFNVHINLVGFRIVVFRSDEKIGYGIVWELQNDDRSLDAHDRLLLTPIKIFIHQK